MHAVAQSTGNKYFSTRKKAFKEYLKPEVKNKTLAIEVYASLVRHTVMRLYLVWLQLNMLFELSLRMSSFREYAYE